VIGNALRLPRPGYRHCRGCRAQFNVLNATPMEGTHLPFRTWFGAIYPAATSSKGVPAMVLSRQLDIGYKTAWFLAQRIRSAEDQPKGRGGSRKAKVVVGVERDGKAKAKQGRSRAERTIAAFVYRHVDRSSALFTDDLPAYRWIGSKFPVHLSVNHARGEFARRDPLAIATAHVNPAESSSAILKRAWVGVWHWFSIKHMHRYLDQIVFHWNRRKADTETRLAAIFMARGKRLRFRDCVA
jgi:hypothetical protein